MGERLRAHQGTQTMAALHQSAFQRCNQKTSARRQSVVTPTTQKGLDPHRTAAENITQPEHKQGKEEKKER